MKYRKKPVVIEAYQYKSPLFKLETFDGVPEWLKEARATGLARYNSNNQLTIKTLEGAMRANIGDYIIKGVQGEIYPCKPDIFEATYEKVEDEEE